MKRLNFLWSSLVLLSVFFTGCELIEGDKQLPEVSFTLSTDTAEINDTIFFTNQSELATSYRWYFGDGTNSAKENPSHVYEEGGDYTIQLNAYNADGKSTKKKKIHIIYPEPEAAFVMDTNFYEPGVEITFTNQSKHATEYCWYFGDGDSSLLENPTHTYVEEGMYTVQLIASNTDGSNSVESDITIAYPVPEAKFTTDTTVYQPGETVYFNNQSVNVETYSWDFGDGTTSVEENPTHIYTSEGTYTVSLTAVGTGGEASFTKQLEVYYPSPEVDFTISKTEADPNEELSFTNATKYAETYVWDFGDGTTSTEENPTHTYTSEGTFTVKLTATGIGGVASATQTVTVDINTDGTWMATTTESGDGFNSASLKVTISGNKVSIKEWAVDKGSSKGSGSGGSATLSKSNTFTYTPGSMGVTYFVQLTSSKTGEGTLTYNDVEYAMSVTKQ